jgi:hypothetical protein
LSFKLKTDKKSTAHVALLSGMLIGLIPALKAHEALQEIKSKAAEGELNHVLTQGHAIQGGLRNGASWKADITEAHTIDQVVEIAKAPAGLMSGPGKSISALKDEIDKAWKAYKAEVAKYGVTTYRAGLEQAVTDMATLSQTSAFESQLIRSLCKPLAEQTASITKYLKLYAHVPPDKVLPQIWLRCQVIVHGSS